MPLASNRPKNQRIESAPRVLCKPEKAAEYWGVSLKTVRNWIFSGRIEFVRVGSRAVRIPLDEINRVIAEGTRPVRSA